MIQRDNNLATENLIAHALWTISGIRIPGATKHNQKCLRFVWQERMGIRARSAGALENKGRLKQKNKLIIFVRGKFE